MPRITTYEDAVQHIRDVANIDRVTAQHRLARRAVRNALERLAHEHPWSYYKRRVTFASNAPVTTGMIALGGGGVAVIQAPDQWPDWVELGRIKVGDRWLEIDHWDGDDTIVVAGDIDPDVTSPTSFTLVRDRYALPADFHAAMRLTDQSNRYELAACNETDSWDEYTPGTPDEFSIRAEAEYLGQSVLVLSPPPVAARGYLLEYTSDPRSLAIESHSAGTVSSTAGSDIVEGTGTSFPEHCVGSVFRVHGTDTPTGVAGAGRAAEDSLVEPVFERVVIARSSDSQLQLDAAVQTGVSSAKYTLSDPIDVDHGVMLRAFWALLTAEYATLAGHRDAEAKEAAAIRALRKAVAADDRTPHSGFGTSDSNHPRLVMKRW